jgi:predicted metal-dependent peptidase
MSSNTTLEQAIYTLLGKLPYYGCLIQSMKHVISKEVSTAGVRFDDNGASVRLTVNPDFFDSLTIDERVALLIHEASHVDRLHLIRIPQATSNHRLGNVAADAAINCYIPNLPKGGIYPKALNLKNYQSFEYYLDRLTDNLDDAKRNSPKPKSDSVDSSDDNEGDSESDGDTDTTDTPKAKTPLLKRYIDADTRPIDTHDWDNSGLSLSEQAGVIESTMKRAIDKLGFDSGQLPSHVQESLQLLRELKVKTWHRELKKFLGRTVNGFDFERTWSRRNRRYGLQEAGSKISGQKKLAIAFDTSGSMSVQELERCLAETMSMVKSGVVGHLIQFDTEVNHIQPLKRNTEVLEIVGRGGTSFVDLMAKVDELRCDGLVVFTDGHDNDTCDKPKTPVLWVHTAGENEKYDWGFKTTLDKE